MLASGGLQLERGKRQWGTTVDSGASSSLISNEVQGEDQLVENINFDDDENY